MKWAILVLLILTIGLLLWILISGVYKREVDVTGDNLANLTIDRYDNYHAAFYQDKKFYGGLEDLKSDRIIKERVYGGIVSHHMLAAAEIAKFFVNLKEQNPKTVVILGPNHYGLSSNFFISKYPFKTPWGVLEPDLDTINALIEKGYVENREKPFEIEHSISSLVGFVKYVFSDAKIVPIILSNRIPKEQLDKLVEELDQVLPSDALVISSVDFSHHLNRIASDFHDEKSISAISSFNLENIYNLEIDSPASIYTLLKYLEKRGAQRMEYTSTNAAELLGEYGLEDVTSYLFAYFMRGAVQKDESISLLSFGDSIFDRDIRRVINKSIDPFEHIKGVEGNFLKGVDFINVNLEGPITDRSDCLNKTISFKFDPQTAGLLFENNINVVNLANNHIFDCRKQGIEDTRRFLDDYGIGYFGGMNLEDSYNVKEVNGRKVAFIGIDYILRPIKLDLFLSLIEKMKADNDYVIVNIHWGYEYNTFPSKTQKEVAYSLIDNGADLIIGHHPHVIQPVEIYKGKAIFYSLGNFIFDQNTKETNEGIGIGVVLKSDEYTFYIFPYRIVNRQPTLLPYNETAVFCRDFLENIDIKDICSFSQKQ